MFRKKSILFVCPDYHCSFILRDQFRKLGWRADVYIPFGYPENLLYKNEGFSLVNFNNIKNPLIRNVLISLLMIIYGFIFLCRYKYFLIYHTMKFLRFPWDRHLEHFGGNGFFSLLSLAKRLNIKILYLASGCCDKELPSVFAKLDKGNVCDNCWFETCTDEKQASHFEMTKRYGDFFFGGGWLESTQLPLTHVRYKSLDLNLWKPDMKIPEKFVLPYSKNIRIMHSYYPGDRTNPGKNIKGSPFILEAVDKLKAQGFPVEYFCPVENIPSKYMRFYQVQADIIVEQLIYGCWGSTGVETMALGKPVVCYIRPSWNEFFLKTFPEYNELPIVEADTNNIYHVLKELVIDEDYRKQKGRESRLFAERHFDVKKNAVELEKVFLGL